MLARLRLSNHPNGPIAAGDRFPLLVGENPINSPACIGDIANLVASKIGKPLEEILSRSVENGVRLYHALSGTML